MFDDIEDCTKTAVVGGLAGFVISAISPILGTFGTLFSFIGLTSSILVVFAIKYFGTGYIIGWLFGMYIIGSVQVWKTRV
jgi:hypothetical protein